MSEPSRTSPAVLQTTGILLFLFPGPGALAVVLWIGSFALVSGVLLVVLAFRLRSRMTVLHPRTA